MAGNRRCSTGWRVTGYFTPVEADYPASPTVTVTIQETGRTRTLRSGFASAVMIEGWGRTLSGDYVGHYGGGWHLSPVPLDAHDAPLTLHTVAVHPAVLPQGTQLNVPTLPPPYNTRLYWVTDTGVTGRHVDVYCGEGSAAEQVRIFR